MGLHKQDIVATSPKSRDCRTGGSDPQFTPSTFIFAPEVERNSISNKWGPFLRRTLPPDKEQTSEP